MEVSLDEVLILLESKAKGGGYRCPKVSDRQTSGEAHSPRRASGRKSPWAPYCLTVRRPLRPPRDVSAQTGDQWVGHPAD